ncbi:hypothetical protein B14911_25890 [Bacillus sp. NRRL B-14911]|nr:hypothetical protein B14911_25890 [Bacillus sp. NRRL B-14911]
MKKSPLLTSRKTIIGPTMKNNEFKPFTSNWGPYPLYGQSWEKFPKFCMLWTKKKKAALL